MLASIGQLFVDAKTMGRQGLWVLPLLCVSQGMTEELRPRSHPPRLPPSPDSTLPAINA
jgi:hypothetical protein